MDKNQTATTITLMSFGFKHGTPENVNVMMDVRFLQNPHWVENLRPLSGLDEGVGNYIRQDPQFDEFLENFTNLLKPLLARHKEKDEEPLTIAVGCTGGKHRSVFTVETLNKWLKEQNLQTHIEHRDLQ